MKITPAVSASIGHQDTDITTLFAEFRAARVAWWPEMRGWAVSRYDDVRQVLADHARFSSDVMQSAFFGMRPGEDADPQMTRDLLELADSMPYHMVEGRNIIATDPPDHAAMRALVARAFMPRQIAGWELRTQIVADKLLANLSGKTHFDLVDDWAGPLPTIVVADMLGVASERQADFKRWSDTLLGSLTAVRNKQSLRDSGFMEASSSLANYLAEQVAERERAPRDDVISLLVDERRGPRLSAADAVNFAQLLLVAGNETTTHLISNLCRFLLDDPALVEQLREDETLIAPLIEETLRLESPTQLLFRRARCDLMIADHQIAKDDVIVVMLAAANRDPEVFDSPDELRLDRDIRRGRAQTAFGYGPHFCVGAALARMEARVATRNLLPVISHLKLDKAAIRYTDSYVMRGYTSMPVDRI